MSASSSVMPHLTPRVLPKQLIKLQEGPYSGPGLPGRGPAWCPAEGARAFALPRACPQYPGHRLSPTCSVCSHTQGPQPLLLLSLGPPWLPTLLTTCPSPRLPAPPPGSLPLHPLPSPGSSMPSGTGQEGRAGFLKNDICIPVPAPPTPVVAAALGPLTQIHLRGERRAPKRDQVHSPCFTVLDLCFLVHWLKFPPETGGRKFPRVRKSGCLWGSPHPKFSAFSIAHTSKNVVWEVFSAPRTSPQAGQQWVSPGQEGC